MLNFYDPNMMSITIRQKNILSVFVFDPRIFSEKEKLSVSVSAVSVRIRSVFIPACEEDGLSCLVGDVGGRLG
jgi:hypothetical protein